MGYVPVTKDNIDDLIDSWHESDTEQKLHEYLRLTLEQYSQWVETNKLPDD